MAAWLSNGKRQRSATTAAIHHMSNDFAAHSRSALLASTATPRMTLLAKVDLLFVDSTRPSFRLNTVGLTGTRYLTGHANPSMRLTCGTLHPEGVTMLASATISHGAAAVETVSRSLGTVAVRTTHLPPVSEVTLVLKLTRVSSVILLLVIEVAGPSPSLSTPPQRSLRVRDGLLHAPAARSSLEAADAVAAKRRRLASPSTCPALDAVDQNRGHADAAAAPFDDAEDGGYILAWRRPPQWLYPPHLYEGDSRYVTPGCQLPAAPPVGADGIAAPGAVQAAGGGTTDPADSAVIRGRGTPGSAAAPRVNPRRRARASAIEEARARDERALDAALASHAERTAKKRRRDADTASASAPTPAQRLLDLRRRLAARGNHRPADSSSAAHAASQAAWHSGELGGAAAASAGD